MPGTSRHSRLALGPVLAALVLGLALPGCGGGERQFANEATGEFPVEVISAEFDRRQRVAEHYELTIAVRNSGDETIPAFNTTLNLPGMDSTLAFAYRDPQEGLAQPQRPVWVMETGYPKLAGTVGRGGTNTASRRTFNFGELEPGDTANMVWRVVAVRPGNYELSWQVAAGLGGESIAVDEAGEPVEGMLPVRINNRARLTEVDEDGNVVPLSRAEQLRLDLQEAQEDLRP